MTCAASESPYPAAPRRERSASQTRCVTAMTELGDQPARLAKAAQRVNAPDTDGVLPPHTLNGGCYRGAAGWRGSKQRSWTSRFLQLL